MVDVVQQLSRVWLIVTPWTAARQASLSFTIPPRLLWLVSIESVMPSNHLILCCPLLLLPSILPNIRVFSNESALCTRWPVNIQDWFPLGLTGLIFLPSKVLRSLLQLTVQKYQFFSTQPSLWSNSHIHTTGKTIALTIQTFVSKVMSLLLNKVCLNAF